MTRTAARAMPPAFLGDAHMLREMGEQPAVLEALLERREELGTAVAAARPAELRGTVLVARGSSDHAALYGRYRLEAATERPAMLAAPSLWTRYGVRGDLAGYLAVGLSQSGRTDEIATTLALMGSRGAATIAITNDVDSPLAASADVVLALATGSELAVPATKTVSAQMAILAIVAEELSARRRPRSAWQAVVDAQRWVLDDLAAMRPAADLIARSRSTVHLARGHALAVAHESALKTAECTGTPSQAYAAPDFLHGPVAAAAGDVAVVAYSAPGPTHGDVELAVTRAQEMGSPVIGVGCAADHSTVRLQVPDAVEELAPLVLVVRAQQLAYCTALRLGLDPDTPPDLTKVTHTT